MLKKRFFYLTLLSILALQPIAANEKTSPKKENLTAEADKDPSSSDSADDSGGTNKPAYEEAKAKQDADSGAPSKNSGGTNKPDEEDKKEEKEETYDKEPPRIGNFSLPTSQQPAGLFSFGGNILDKGEVQLYLFADEFRGRKKVITDVIPSVLFGITDELSIFFNAPFTPELRDGIYRSSGLEDFFIQLEWAFYNKKTIFYEDQATVVFNVAYPTGSIHKNPPTGFGSPSFFLGGTYYRLYIDWFVFTCNGGLFTTSDHRYKIGEQFLYQMGFGRYIPSPKDWIYAWMIEVDGQYSKKNRFRGHLDPNSGGNFILVTPSLWVSNNDFLVQFGISWPVTQNLFGKQNKFNYALNFNFAWSFY